jgi:uncharacterized protein YcgI (DUF1989 family)
MLVELGKHGLGERDLIANINFFSKVTVDEAGALQRHAVHARNGDHIDLRFEMDTIVVLHAGLHPLDERPRHDPPGVQLAAFKSLPLGENDACLNRCPENTRGYRNTTMHYLP